MAERSIAADCKSADFGLRGFESLPAHRSLKARVAVVAQSVEHLHGKEKVTGPIPVNGSDRRGYVGHFKTCVMGAIKENMVKLRCNECKKIVGHTKRNKKKVKEKLSLQKFCKSCRKHTLQTESK